MKIKYVQSELNIDEYVELKKRAEERGITLKEAVKEAISNWLREKSGFNPEDPFFNTSKMFRSKKDLADKHDEIYEDTG